MPLKEWLRFGETEGCSVIFRYCLALLMDRLLSWTAMAECWPMCSFMSQMASSTCPGTTPASWWRTAARATRTLMTTPHHKVGLCAHPSVSALHVLINARALSCPTKPAGWPQFQALEKQTAGMAEWVCSQLCHQPSCRSYLICAALPPFAQMR